MAKFYYRGLASYLILPLLAMSICLAPITGTAASAAPAAVKGRQLSFKQAVANQDLTRAMLLLELEPQLASSADCLEQVGLLQAFYFDQSQANKLLSSAHSRDRHNPHITCSLAYGLVRNGQAALALDVLQQAINTKPDDRRALAVKAYALAHTGQALASDRILEQLVSTQGRATTEENLMLLRVRVLLLLDRLKEQEALLLMDNYIKANPDNIAARMMRAQTLRPLGKWQTSVTDLRHILSICPDNDFAQRTLADVYRQHQMYAEAAKCYRLFLQTAPHRSKVVVGNRGLAICLEELHQYKDACLSRLAVLEANANWLKLKSEHNHKSNTSIDRELSLDIYCFARDLRLAGQIKQCLVPLNILLMHFPRQKAALQERALAYEALKQYKECKQDLDLLILEQPDYPHFYSERARIYKATGDLDKAAKDLARAKSLELK